MSTASGSGEMDAKDEALRALDRLGSDVDPCGMGCGEMGSCHVNLSDEARIMAEFIFGRNRLAVVNGG